MLQSFNVFQDIVRTYSSYPTLATEAPYHHLSPQAISTSVVPLSSRNEVPIQLRQRTTKFYTLLTSEDVSCPPPNDTTHFSGSQESYRSMVHETVKVLLTISCYLLQDLVAIFPSAKDCDQCFQRHRLSALEPVPTSPVEDSREPAHLCVDRVRTHSVGECSDVADVIVSEIPIVLVLFDVILPENGRGFLSDGTADGKQIVA
jgi:hypothetical protein